MIILGIDPGTRITGYGVIKCLNNNFIRVAGGSINLPVNEPIPQRLEIIYSEISKIIKKYKPDEFAIETAFYGKNVQSAMKIGYARGVSILCALRNNVLASEYSPREVKKSVVGKGAASKEQVSFMIKTLLNIKSEKIKVDESDALAIALYLCFQNENSVKKTKDWKSFVEALSERVIG
ncbi:MAG: crossover junction endodeoxyribonuclease RuvC [Ignavibacteriales bacterium]|nr:crossover junction endodeoxyribonuclease RuvC [Ignavibacteriales bacterium]